MTKAHVPNPGYEYFGCQIVESGDAHGNDVSSTVLYSNDSI